MSHFLTSSLGKKTVMAATGLFLVVFLVEHLYTNLLLFANDGGASFNEASHTMVHSLIIRIIEVGLFIAIIVHIVQAVYLTKKNSDARPIQYAVSKTSETSTWFSRNMLLTGSIIFFFIVVHLYQFFVPYRVIDTVGHAGQESVAYEVKEAMQDGRYAALYLVAVTFLAFHLNHGFQSAFQSLGLNNKKYAGILKLVGTAIAFIFWLGYSSFPVLFFFNLAGNSITQ